MAKNSKNSKPKRTGNNGGGHRTKVTPKLMGKFLDLLASNGGIVTHAVNRLNISRKSIYEKRRKDSKFKQRWEEALDAGIDVLEDEAKIRALDGIEEPVFYQGVEVAQIRRKSDYLMSLLLKGHRPKYRIEKHEITGADGQPLSSNVIVYLPDNARQKKGTNKTSG